MSFDLLRVTNRFIFFLSLDRGRGIRNGISMYRWSFLLSSTVHYDASRPKHHIVKRVKCYPTSYCISLHASIRSVPLCIRPPISYIFLFLRLNLSFSLLQNQLLPFHPLPHIRHVLYHRLKVRGGIVRFGDEDVVCRTISGGGVKGRNGDEPVGKGEVI